jgi:hypothetical protein
LALPHFAKGKAKAAPYEFERRARPVVRRAGVCSMGRGRPPLDLLYVAPMVCASAIGTYPYDV